MIKQKRFFLILFAVITALVAFVTAGIRIAGKGSQAFAGDGYVLSSEEVPVQSGSSTAEAVQSEPLYFSAGTSYRSKYPQALVFKDVQGNKRTIDYYSFVHYADDSVSALTDGILVNMDDIGMGIVNHYSLRGGIVMAANGDGYTVENNKTQINFHNFIWKLSDSVFLLHSNELLLKLPDGTQEVLDGFLEANYIEKGIIRLTDKERQWQVVADGTLVSMSNGVMYDFGDKIIRDARGISRLTYQEMLLSADDNIQVQSAQDWVAPEFEFEVIDGQSGEDGEDGEDGTSGNAGQNGAIGQKGGDGESGDEGDTGEEGDAGDEGSQGRTGTAGATGSSGVNGASGEQGAAGTVTDKETMAQASFSITDFKLTAGTLKVTFAVIDDDGVLGTAGSVKLLDAQGNSIDDWSSAELNPDENGELEFSGDAEYTVYWDSLNPDTQYRLVVSSNYVLKNVNGQRDYINRTFYTDSSGLQLEKVYATEDGFGMELTRNSYSEATGALITILDAAGNEMMNYNVSSSAFDSGGVLELSTDSGFSINQSLSSNTGYVIKLESMVGGTLKDNGNRQTWKTLKKKPVLGSAEGYANSQTYFNLSVQDVLDKDAAIVEYRYDVYRTGSTTALKSVTSSDNKSVALYIDDVNILRGVSYQVMVSAVYYDNEKTAEVQTGLSEAFIMGETGEISVSFEWADGADRITELEGNLRIAPKDAGAIGIGPDKPLTVQIESSGYYKRVLEFDNAQMAAYLVDGVYNIPLHLYGLKQSSSYRISVWGYVLDNAAEMTYVYQLVGDYVVSTTNHTRVYVDTETANNGSAVGTYIYLGAENDETEPVNYSNTLKSIRAVEVKLYTGSTISEGNLVATALAVDDALTPNNPYQNTIAGTYYGAKGRAEGSQIYVDETTFLKTAGDMTANQYCISVSAIYDYTYHYDYEYNEIVTAYYNTIPLDETSTASVVLNVSNRLPDFPTPQTTGVVATAIRFKELANYGLTYAGTDQDLYLDDTIVGYNLQARFDNSGALAKTVTYYAFTQTDLNAYKADTDANKGEDVMLWRKAKIGTVNRPWMQVTVPVDSTSTSLTGINVLFMEPPAGATSISVMDTNLQSAEATENADSSISGIYDQYLTGTTPTFFARDLERGWHYIFSYTARLDYQGQPSYKYPNNYTGRFISGQTLLSTAAIDTPRQKSDVKMYLYQTMEDGSYAARGLADWRYQYTDLDGAAAMEFDSIDSYAHIQEVFAAYNASNVGSSGILTAPDDPGGTYGGYKTLRLRATGSMEYIIQMMQDLYHSDNEYNDSGDTADTEMGYLAEYQYTLPVSPSTVTGSSGIGVTLDPAVSGNTMRFTFSFGSSVTGMEKRIERVTIWAVDGSGQTISGSSQTFYGFTGTNTSNLNYISYDLSRAGNVGDTVKFRVSIVYDSGYAGDYYVESAGTNDRFAVKTALGSYVVRRYYTNSLGATVLSNIKTNTSAWYSSYEVRSTTATSVTQADQAWMIINAHSTIQSDNDASYPQPVLNLRYTAKGAYDVVEGNYPVFNRIDTATFAGSNLEYTISSLTPSVNSAWFTKGLTTLAGSFTTNSYQLIETTAPTGLTAGKYIHVTLYRYENDNPSGNYETNPSWEGYVEITSQDTTATYSFLADELVSGGYYRIELNCEQSGGGEALLWDTSKDAVTVYTVQLLDSMNIDDMEFSDIQYVTYENKYVTLSYTLDLTSGFEIEYSLEVLQSDSNYTALADHDEVMAAMGYSWNGTNWVKTLSSGATSTWTILSSMLETISLSPGSVMKPGNTYRLTVKAVDSANEVVGESSAVFTWPVLSKPDFYVTTTPGASGESITVKLDPIDTNKVIVEGGYYVVLWDGDTIKYFSSFQVNSGLQSEIPINDLTANTGYDLCIYARLDMDNAGGLSGLTLTKELLENMSQTEREALLIYHSTERTLEAWGGRYDSLNIRFNNSNNLRIDMFNGYNLFLIDEIRVTVYKEGVSKNFTLKKSGSIINLFSPIGSSTTDYYTVVTTDGSLAASGVYSVTCSFMKEDVEQFRETKSVVMD